MKVVIKKCVSIVLFTAILIFSVMGVSSVLDKPDVDEKYKQFFAEKNNFDVVFMGTSHTYNTVMPQEIWAKYSIPSYNWGNSNCTMPVSYYVLQMLCEYTKPKLVVIDLFGVVDYSSMGNGKYRPDVRDQQRVQFDVFPVSTTKIKAVLDIFDDYESRWDFFFKMGIYHSRWKELDREDFIPRNIPQKGAAFVLGVNSLDYTEKAGGNYVNLETVGLEYLVKIIEYCRENNIEMLFTYMPFVATEGNGDEAAAFEEFFKKYPDCTYVNMLTEGIINYRTDVYTDGSHLNYIGASVVTDWLGAYIAQNYPYVVHEGDDAYAHWNDNYDEYVDYKISRFKPDMLYDNLQLLYGSDFKGEITVSRDYVSAFEGDIVAQNLIERLGDRISIKVEPYETVDGNLRFSVTDNRNGSIVFDNVMK